MSKGWIGVDLDGTLAKYDSWKGVTHIGEPVPIMVQRVQNWLAEGREVRIFTARMADRNAIDRELAREAIGNWCKKHIGQWLNATCVKDFAMIELWDDRAVQVQHNTGLRVGSMEFPA